MSRLFRGRKLLQKQLSTYAAPEEKTGTIDLAQYRARKNTASEAFASTMDCRELDNLLYPYLDEELVDGDRVQMEAHLATCESCRKRTDQEHAVLLFVRSRRKSNRLLRRKACAPDCQSS